MKLLISIGVFAAVLLIVQALEHEEESIQDKCMVESGVNSEVIANAEEGQFVDDIKLKKHIFCMFKRFGMMNESGQFQKDVLFTRLDTSMSDPATTRKTIDKCAVQKSTPHESAFEAAKCIMAANNDFRRE